MRFQVRDSLETSTRQLSIRSRSVSPRARNARRWRQRFRWCNRFALVPRNFFKQPNIWYVDARLSRRFSITESTKLEFLVEGFNVFNRTQVTGVRYDVLFNLYRQHPELQHSVRHTTGADSTLFRERQVQLAVALRVLTDRV